MSIHTHDDAQAVAEPPSLEATSTSWAELLRTLPDGFDHVPEEVVLRAAVDERFAHYLLASSNNPSMIAMLFADPRNADYRATAPVDQAEAPAGEPSPAQHKRHTTPAMLASAARSVARWGKAAFESADPAEAERRLSVCRDCPHVESVNAMPAVVRVTTSETMVCGECGCPLGRKARMRTERCPAEDPNAPGFNRWGQPLAA